MSHPPTRLRVWLQLLRAPNLFTVPGDPLAGYLLANSGFCDHSLPLVLLASLCFYSAGLLMNDLVDLEEDRVDRPSRPLPAGLATRSDVQRILWLLNGLGLSLLLSTGKPLCALTGVGVIASVWSYNHILKRIPFLGAINMGLCRSLSVMSGATTGPSPSAMAISAIFAGVTGLFIAAITHLARFETRPPAPIHARILPIIPLGFGAWFGGLNAIFAPDKVPSLLFFGAAVLGALWLLRRLFASPPAPLPPLIGAHIRLLLPLQAGVCWLGASQQSGPIYAILLLLLWPVSRLVSKRFYAS